MRHVGVCGTVISCYAVTCVVVVHIALCRHLWYSALSRCVIILCCVIVLCWDVSYHVVRYHVVLGCVMSCVLLCCAVIVLCCVALSCVQPRRIISSVNAEAESCLPVSC